MPYTPSDSKVLTPWPAHPYGDKEECEFCKKFHRYLYSFQGKPICTDCNDKLVERIKLILKLE